MSCCFVQDIVNLLLRVSVYVQYVQFAYALWWVSVTERETEAGRRRSVLCGRLPVPLRRRHTLLLDRWLGYSGGLAASSQERMEALCGRMSWTLWKGRSSQTERKKRGRRRLEGCRNWWGRGKEGTRWGRLTKLHPHIQSLDLVLCCLSDWGRRWAAWVVSSFQRRCQWEPRRNRYLCLLSGHVELSQPNLQGLGGAPLAYYLVLAFLSPTQRDLHHQVLSMSLFYVDADCIFRPIVSEFLDL